MKQFFVGALFSAMLVVTSSGRTFTNIDGRQMEGEMISASETQIVVKSLKNRKTYTIKISTLTDDDQKFIAGWREEMEKSSAELAEIKLMKESIKRC